MTRLATQPATKPKYKNVKCAFDGYSFDSKAEMCYYRDVLKPLASVGAITELRLQPEYELQPAFRDASGKKHRAITYIADFKYIEGARVIVVDVKGFKTADFKLKEKMFRYRYPDIDFQLPKAK